MNNDSDAGQAVNKGTLAPGTMLDHYRLGKCLGVGGMGEVYYAVHDVLQTPCAIKIIRPEVAQGNSGVAARLIREARMACSVQHDNIVGVLDASATSNLGCPYIVMEYVDGVSVEKYLESGPMSEEDVIAVALGVTEALIAAAKYKIVHRDIKPGNIMINSRGTVKLADLGIAKSDSAAMGGTLTQENALLGTPNYAAPEQLRSSHTVDARADIYSLGATMYHLLSGRKPFDGDTVFNVLAKVVCEEPPTFKELGVEISQPLEELIEKMMSKDPAQRPSSALELKEMLLKVARGQRIGDTGLKARLKELNWTFRKLSGPRRAAVLLFAVAAAALLGFGIFGRGRSPEPAKTPPAPAQVVPRAPAPPGKKPAPPAPVVPAPKSVPPAPPVPAPAPKPVPAVKTPAVPPAPAAKASAKPALRGALVPPSTAKKTPEKTAPLASRPARSSTAVVWPVVSDGIRQTFEPFDLPIEERMKRAAKRLNELKTALRARSGGNAKNALLDEKIAFREEQLRFLAGRLRIKREQQARRLNNSWSVRETEAFKKEVEEYLEKHRPGVWRIGASEEFCRNVCQKLKSGRIDVNMIVRDVAFPDGAGPLLLAALSGRLNQGNEWKAVFVDLFAKLKADFSVLGNKNNPTFTLGRNVLSRILQVQADHIDSFSARNSNLETLLLPEVFVTNGVYSFGSIDPAPVRTMVYLACAVNFKTPGQGQTPLHLAAFAGNAELVRLLLLADADPDRENNFGQTPLFAAAMSGKEEVYDLLLKYTASPDKKDIFGKRADERKWDGKLRRAVLARDSAGGLEALKHKADPNAMFGNSQTLLLIACSQKDAAMVKLLLQYGADPDGPYGSYYARPLSRVAFDRPTADLEIFKLLVENGATPFIVAGGRSFSLLDRLLVNFSYNGRIRSREEFEKLVSFLRYMLSCGKFDMDPFRIMAMASNCQFPPVLAVIAAHAPMPDELRAHAFLRTLLQRRMPKSVIKPLLDRDLIPPDSAQLRMALRMNNYADVIELFRGKLPDDQIDLLLKNADREDSDKRRGMTFVPPAFHTPSGTAVNFRSPAPRAANNAEVANMLLGGRTSRPATGRDELLDALYARRPRSVIRNLIARRNGSMPDEKKLISALQVNNYADVIKLFRGKIDSDQVDRLLKNADKRDSDRVAGSGRNRSSAGTLIRRR